MGVPAGFNFESVAKLPVFEDTLVGFVPRNLSNVNSLLQSVADVLLFPAYFGGNWNALYDCLRDFSWTDKKGILLVHSDLPQLAEGDLKIYLEVLRNAAADWKSGESHTFGVIFDKSVEPMVVGALKIDAA